jgi:hypothetical protein
MIVVTSSTVAEKAVCWCDGRKIRKKRPIIDREGGADVLPVSLGCGTVSEDACIQADSTRGNTARIATAGGITDSPRVAVSKPGI